MEQTPRKVLIIGGGQEMVRAVSRLLETDFHLLQAGSETEGWTKAREERPDAIVLGHLEPRGTSFKLHNRLRGGWITKHIPQVVVDVHLPGALDGTWTRDEAMQMEAEDYISVSPQAEAGILPLLQSAGLKDILGAKLRSSWNGFRVGRSMVSWQRFTVRLAAHGPVTPLVPASIIQTVPSELHLTETLAADITPQSVEEFSWY